MEVLRTPMPGGFQEDVVVAMRGTLTQKLINGRLQKVVPFVGGTSTEMGIGTISPETVDERSSSDFRGLVSPHDVICSWRAMKLYELVEHAGMNMCLDLAGFSVIPEGYLHAHYEFVKQVGGVKKLRVLHRKVHEMSPSAIDLDTMIVRFLRHGTEVDVQELKKELEAGHIEKTFIVKMLLED